MLCFGERAAGYFGTAALLLGWTPAEFWESTPAELLAALRPAADRLDGPKAEEINRLRAQFPDDKHG